LCKFIKTHFKQTKVHNNPQEQRKRVIPSPLKTWRELMSYLEILKQFLLHVFKAPVVLLIIKVVLKFHELRNMKRNGPKSRN
jgi:hypothetical protein